ncbi:protein PIGBOS1 [Microcaecilia unicolor]|uniref:Protein PIGBOS1 n=1 Tax=Microcaecilia unicolor TaxID=1415580 RepID=A0A6P7WY59_9AMPH|nr:protein PIGBOS1 [Microcaecilia unicolor]XP_030046091.1 protein PIGBOS1 [Microcaecilia unicolor]XP_030046092.1 protein PIGBOS1 [Microcaecilia unicolor]
MHGRFSIPQILLATLLGIAGGLYIYKPIYEQYYWDQKKLKATLATAEEAEKKND